MVCKDQVVDYIDHDVIYKDHDAILKIKRMAITFKSGDLKVYSYNKQTIYNGFSIPRYCSFA